jgi:nicotinamidase-related amidase
MNSVTNKWMIDPNDAVMLFIDHQSGLFQLVRDIDQPTLRAHVTALAKVSYLARIPTFTTASTPDGPNGPLIPEIHQYNPDAVYIPRTGQVNAWDNPAWVKAIQATKRNTLLMAGTLASVCMAFAALGALNAGYRVFAIIDASGNWSKMATELTIVRLAQAGAMPVDTYALLCELMSTWNRADAMEFAAIMVDHILPPYRAVIESYDKAHAVQKIGGETKLELLQEAAATK